MELTKQIIVNTKFPIKIAKVVSIFCKQHSLKEIRLTHPNAYRSWDKEQDDQLKILWTFLSIKEIAERLKRTKGAVESRIKKLELKK